MRDAAGRQVADTAQTPNRPTPNRHTPDHQALDESIEDKLNVKHGGCPGVPTRAPCQIFTIYLRSILPFSKT